MNIPNFGTWSDVLPWLEKHQRRIRVGVLVGVGGVVGLLFSNIIESVIWARMPIAPPPDVQTVSDDDYVPPPLSDFAVIVERNFFRVDIDRAAPPPVPVDEATKPVTMPVQKKIEISPLPAEVIGTMGGSDEVAVALIRDKRNKEVDLYWVGDKLFDQATILKINRGEVLILRNGKTESLQLFDEGGTLFGPGSEDQDDARGQEGGRDQGQEADSGVISKAETSESEGEVVLTVEEVGENDYIIDKQQFEQVMGNLGPLLTQARVVPNFSQGRINGYKIFAIKSGSVFQQIGLQNGDVVHSVNGVSIDTPEKAIQLFQQLRAETDFNLDVERGGSPSSFSYRLR